MNTQAACTPGGGWIVTRSGRLVWPLEPKAEDIIIDDIAHALAHQCRFTGHCRKFYSVAQHSVYVSRLVEQAAPVMDKDAVAMLALHGLMHDAPEAYLCDVARPVKHHDGFAFYRDAEDRLYQAIALRFGLDLRLPSVVKAVDNKIVQNEAVWLMPTIPDGWRIGGLYTHEELFDALGTDLFTSWTPEQAYEEFMQAYQALTESLPVHLHRELAS